MLRGSYPEAAGSLQVLLTNMYCQIRNFDIGDIWGYIGFRELFSTSFNAHAHRRCYREEVSGTGGIAECAHAIFEPRDFHHEAASRLCLHSNFSHTSSKN